MLFKKKLLSKHLRIGKWGEHQAKNFLLHKRLTFVDENYKCKWGEIDLIFHHQNDLIIVEVKTLSQDGLFHAYEKVTPKKQRKILLTALHFTQRFPKWECFNYRFDIISIQNKKIEWIKNAFDAHVLENES